MFVPDLHDDGSGVTGSSICSSSSSSDVGSSPCHNSRHQIVVEATEEASATAATMKMKMMMMADVVDDHRLERHEEGDRDSTDGRTCVTTDGQRDSRSRSSSRIQRQPLHHHHHDHFGGGSNRRRKQATAASKIWTAVAVLVATTMMMCYSPSSSSSTKVCSSSSSSFFFVSAANNNNYYNDDDGANNYNGDDDGANNYNGDDDGAAEQQDDDGEQDQQDEQNQQQQQQQQERSWDDDLFDWDVPNQDGFNSLSIMPVSCINYNNGQMIKFDLFDETSSSYQCHFNQIGTFVVSIAHYMRAYFNYQALSQGRDFSLPSDAGYLNCVALSQFQVDDDEVEDGEDEDAEGEEAENEEGDDANNSNQLYAKIGCMERETFTSTRLQLHLYTDAQCSEPYDDGLEGRTHSNKGYEIDGEMFSTRVSFRPPFFTCQSCSPDEISETFNKKYGTWYDDDYISEHGQKRGNNNNEEEDNPEDEGDDGVNNNDDASGYYYKDDGYIDDTYMSANDDLGQYSNGNPYNNYNNNNQNKYNYDQYNQNINKQYYYTDDYNNNARQNYYNNKYYNNNNGGRDRDLRGQNNDVEPMQRRLVPAAGELEKYENGFWRDVASILDNGDDNQSGQHHRQLYDNQYDASDWNMCQQVYKYGLYCDEDCQSLDAFRSDRWSGADIILLSIMCTFMAAMLILIIAKHLRTARKQKRDFYSSNPGLEQFDTPVGIDEKRRKRLGGGLPPVAMLSIFWTVILIIVVLASLKFVNETLVFAVVMCVLFFIYMLKLTLFDARRPVLLAAPKHDEYFDSNPLDQHLFT